MLISIVKRLSLLQCVVSHILPNRDTGETVALDSGMLGKPCSLVEVLFLWLVLH